MSKKNLSGFGAPTELGAHVFRLRTDKTNNRMLLVEDYGDSRASEGEDPEQPRAALPAAVWQQVAPFVRRDFNERLANQKRKKGAWNCAAEVQLDRLLGRELTLLFWALEGLHDHETHAVGSALKSWQQLRPEERWWFAAMAASGAGRPEDGCKGWRLAIRAALVHGNSAVGARS